MCHSRRLLDCVPRFFVVAPCVDLKPVFGMRRNVVLSLAWVAATSGIAWHEPLLASVKLPAAELDRLGKGVEVMAHQAGHCFNLVGC